MNEATKLLEAAQRGDRQAAADLLPLVYDELRRLAAAKLAQEKPGQTLDGTALVHEAYLRLIGPLDTARWTGRSHFFAAAAEAMRRILVDIARRKGADKRGGGGKRVELTPGDRVVTTDPAAMLAIDEALAALELEDVASARLARLRLFAGLTVEEAGDALEISRATAFREWAYARAWLSTALSGDRGM